MGTLTRSLRRGVLVATVALLAWPASAVPIYDNLFSPNSGVDPLTGWGPPLFDSFSTGPSAFSVHDVKLLLSGTPSGNSLSVALYSDNNATEPDTLLLTIGTLSDNALPASLSPVDFPLSSGYTLAANTRYWLVLNSLDGSSARWGWSLDQAALGVSGEFFGHGLSVFSNTGGPYQMQVNGDPVPEPATLLLIGSGLAGLALRRRRAR